MSKIITFDYFPNPYVNSVGKEAVVYRPSIPIIMSYNHRMSKFPIMCLLDSGADKNLFPASWGEVLGMNLTKGKVAEHIGIGGASLIAYTHKITLFVQGRKIVTEADFSAYQSMPLLGRDGFFRFFQSVGFNEKERKITLTC